MGNKSEVNCGDEHTDGSWCYATNSHIHRCIMMPQHTENVSKHWCKICNKKWNQ